MSLPELLSDLSRLGIKLEACDDRLRYFPQSAASPELLNRLKTHKADLLAILPQATASPEVSLGDPKAIWNAVLDRLESDPEFTPDFVQALRNGKVEWKTI